MWEVKGYQLSSLPSPFSDDVTDSPRRVEVPSNVNKVETNFPVVT